MTKIFEPQSHKEHEFAQRIVERTSCIHAFAGRQVIFLCGFMVLLLKIF